MRKKVFVAMSGGVDSSVASWLLVGHGYDVTGVFMRCYNVDGCAARDAEDARRVAAHLSIPFYVWDFEEEYKRRVVEYMIRGYRAGMTPNPDVMCNREVKFGLFLDKALELGADYVATGHYVRKKDSSLYGARDETKDQSYFLWTLTQRELRHCLFPIGEYLKSDVRALAKKAGLPTARKKDSQGICFLGKVTLAEFLRDYIPEERGDVLDAQGRRIGEHAGIQFYTIGQRHLGQRTSVHPTRDNQKPFYVALKDARTNTMTVVEGGDHPLLFKKEVVLEELNFLSQASIGRDVPVYARIRYRQPLVPAKLSDREQGSTLTFKEPVKFVAPGQSAVFYGLTSSNRYELLGGGVIVSDSSV